VAKGYLSKLTKNQAVREYLSRHYSEVLDTFELVVNTVSMEQAVHDEENDQEDDLG
jgi:hypothetical protein